MANSPTRQNGGQGSCESYPQPIYHSLQPASVAQKPMINGHVVQKENIYPREPQLNSRHSDSRDYAHYQRPTPEASFHTQSSSTYSRPQIMTVENSHTKPTNEQMPSLGSDYPGLRARDPFVDYSVLLLSLAEEYLAAAYESVSKVEDRKNELNSKYYYRLVATALGCLETLLGKCKLQPEKEAMVRLRYATVLFEETNNEMEAEEALSKGISIADRHKLFDLKYNMQHLLVRVLFQTRTSAAFKFLDRIMRDAEVYQHSAWVYAFGFLKVSLHLDLGSESRQDTNSAVSALNKVMSLAENHGDTAILAIAATLKAWVFLRSSNSADSFEESQTSLALARGLQGSQAITEVPQVIIMMAFVDLCCCLQQFDPTQAQDKMKHMYDVLSVIPEATNWLNNGSFAVPLRRGSAMTLRLESGIIRSHSDDSLSLLFNWLPKDDIYTVGYLLCGITLVHHHQSKQPSRKAEEMLLQGLKKVDYDQQRSDGLPRPIVPANSLQLWRQHLASYMRLHLAFMLCIRSRWDTAAQNLEHLQDVMRSWSTIPPLLKSLSILLRATQLQGIGHLNECLVLYQGLIESTSGGSSLSANPLLNDVSLVAALNCLLILRDSNHHDHNTVGAIFSRLPKNCVSHPNRQIQAAYHLVHSTLLESATIIGRKQTLQLALNAAKASQSNTSLCIALSLMHWYFFRDQITEQAEKSARAAQNMAHKVENKMWVSATARIMGDHLEAAGRPADAGTAFNEGWEAAISFPREVKAELGWMEEDDLPDVEMRQAGL